MCSASADALELKVDPSGPLASPAAALCEARELRRAGKVAPGEAVRIVCAPGTYRLTAPLSLGPDDSNVSFSGPGKTVFSGGVELRGFAVGADGIWRAKVPNGLDFEQLWVNGARATRARSPNTGYHYIREKVFNGEDPYRPGRMLELDNRAFGGAPQDVAPFANLSRDETTNILVTVYYGWDTDRLHVYHADAKTGRVILQTAGGRNFFMWPKYMTRYTVENFRGALDAPGEWFLDRAKGELLYLPRPGEKPETTVATAPCVEKLLVLKGEAGRPVRNVAFEGIDFATAGYRFPLGIFTRQAAFRIDATIEMANAENVRFANCTLRKTGLHGLSVGSNCRGVEVRECLFEDLGGGGVWIGGRDKPPAGRETRDVTVSDSIIAHTSRLFPEGTAVAVTFASDVKIVHNEIADIGYSGISVGYVWGYGKAPNRNNLVGWNHIHHLGRATMSDMAGIYTLGDNRGTRIVGNIVHDIVSYDYTGAGGEGLYADEGSRGVTWESNLVYRTKGGSININYAMENVFRNNILVNPGCGSPVPEREAFLCDHQTESHLTAVFTNNIGYSDAPVAPLALRKGADGGLLKRNVRLGGNVYFSKTPFAGTAFCTTDHDSWEATGRDPGSVVADPLFVDAAKDDYRLKSESPALKLGFREWNFADAGVQRGGPEWRAKARSYWNQPTPAMPVVPPLFGGVKTYETGFEEFSVGAQIPTFFGFSSSGGRDLVKVTDRKVRHGRRAVEATDLVARQPSYLPHYYVKVTPELTNGLYRCRFSIACEADNALTLDWRDDTHAGGRHTYKVGLSLGFGGGAVKVNGAPALALKDGEWCDVEIAAKVSPETPATFDVTLSDEHGNKKALTGIPPREKGYRKVSWLGFLSYAKKDTRWYLDDFGVTAEDPSELRYDARAGQVECPVSERKGGHENTEWSNLYACHMRDEKCQLPRLLIIGDSIVHAIRQALEDELDGKMNVTSWASSYCVTCPEYLPHLDAVLRSGRFDVVQFNNGLHSLSRPPEKWAPALREALLLVRRMQPQAKLVWATTSPLKQPELSERARALNAAGAKVVAELGGIVTNDIYAFLDPIDREANWKPDGFHHQPPLQKKLAHHIAEFILGQVK